MSEAASPVPASCWEPSHPVTPPTAGHSAAPHLPARGQGEDGALPSTLCFLTPFARSEMHPTPSCSFPDHFSILSDLQQHLRGMQAEVQEPRQTIPSHRPLFLSPKPPHGHSCLRGEQRWLELNTAPFYCDKLPSLGCESVTIWSISSLPSSPCLPQELFILRL